MRCDVVVAGLGGMGAAAAALAAWTLAHLAIDGRTDRPIGLFDPSRSPVV